MDYQLLVNGRNKYSSTNILKNFGGLKTGMTRSVVTFIDGYLASRRIRYDYTAGREHYLKRA